MDRFGWDLPPGITVQDVEEAQEGDADGAGSPNLERVYSAPPSSLSLVELLNAQAEIERYIGNMDDPTMAMLTPQFDRLDALADELHRRGVCSECARIWQADGYDSECLTCSEREQEDIRADINRDLDALRHIEASYRSFTDERVDYDDSREPF